ncbi:glycosyl transferase [Candidatus Shapirobacteria bacterium]|nr:glycosyl transferase [Candidatus Shapirobacteria bacterium]
MKKIKEFNTPILLIGFNRPDLIKIVIDQIGKIEPSKLYIAIDGPRNRFDEEKIDEIKRSIKNIKWKCDLKVKFQKDNLGCKYGPVVAMNWFFEHEEMGIILEDDVLADKTFFYFAQELLIEYKNDKRVGSISGNNFQFGHKNSDDSYYFSRYSHSCGWATWRRVWEKYDIEINSWSKNSEILDKVFAGWWERFYWRLIFNGIKTGEIDSAWDYQWNLMMWTEGMLGIIPNQNLVNNIGFGRPDATHTKFKSKFENMLVEPILFPLKHPLVVSQNIELDAITQRQNYVLWKELGVRLIRRLKLVHR